MKNSTVVGFDSRPVAAELLCPKPLANVLYYGYTSRLKQDFDLGDSTENSTRRTGVRTLALKR